MGARGCEKQERTNIFGANPVSGGSPPRDIRMIARRNKRRRGLGRDNSVFAWVM